MQHARWQSLAAALASTGATYAQSANSPPPDPVVHTECASSSLRLDGSLPSIASDPPAYRLLGARDAWTLASSLSMRQPDSPTNEPSPTSPTASGHSSSSDLAKKLQNPVADLISVPLQFNYDTGIGPKDADRLTLNIQPVIPFRLNEEWNLISRTIVPVIYQGSTASGLDSDFGLGDTVQSLFFSPKEPVDGWILGAGPVALLPTGTDPELRSEQFGLGPTAVALQQRHGWTYGGLANHIWGLHGSEQPDVNATFLQPFVSYTWPSATTLGLNAEATYDWTADELTLPFNLQLSQLASIGDQPVQFQIGGRYYADAPSGGPEWGLRFTITFLFPR